MYEKVGLRIVSDIHGNIDHYLNLIKGSEKSIQIGDLGFDYSRLSELDSNNHKWFGGNHDAYDYEETNLPISFVLDNPNLPYGIKDGKVVKFHKMTPHFLRNYGIYDDIFFIRGADSIDKQLRLLNNWTWHEHEEMSYTECYKAVEMYEKIKPNYVLSHTCPLSITNKLYLPLSGTVVLSSITNKMLDRMFEIHQPKWWIFGHFHQNWQEEVKGTKFICIDKMWALDLDKEKKPCQLFTVN